MKGFIWLSVCTLALNQIKPFQDQIVLTKDEIKYIDLYDYFYGDCLKFKINDTESITLLSSNVTQTDYEIKLTHPTTLPFRISELIHVFPKFTPVQLFIYAGDSNVTIFFIHLEKSYEFRAGFIETDPISQIKVKRSEYSLTIFILSRFNELFYSTLMLDEYIFENFTNPVLIPVEIPENPYMAQGYIYDYLLITGYNGSDAWAYFYDVSSENDTALVQKILLSENNSEPFPQILALATKDAYFVISSATSRMIKFKIGDYGLADIEDVLYLPVFAENVTSISLSSGTDNLLVGVKGGFMIISFNFQQIYRKIGPNFFDEVFVTSGPFRDIVLTGKNHFWNLFELGDHHEIISNTSFKIKEKSFVWNIFCFRYPNYKFVYGITDHLSVFNISFFGPSLEVKSYENPVSFFMTATQVSPFNEISVEFTVRRPEGGIVGSVELMSSPGIFVEFRNLSSENHIALGDYVIGNNLSVTYLNVVIPAEYDEYFNCSYIGFTGNFEQCGETDLNETDYTKILYSLNNLVLYNSNKILIINEGGENQWDLENGEIIEILSCGVVTAIYYQLFSDRSYNLIITINFEKIDLHYPIKLNEKCNIVKCSLDHLACLTNENIVLYRLADRKQVIIPNSIFNSNITTLSIVYNIYVLVSNEYLLVICDYSNLIVFDIQSIFLSSPNEVILNKTMQYGASSILFGKYIYLIDNANNVFVYDFTMDYLKKYQFPITAKLLVAEKYLVSENNGNIQIIDSSQIETNSTITNVSVPLSLDYAANANINDAKLYLYLLQKGKVLTYKVPFNYSNIDLCIDIVNSEELHQVEYLAYVTIEVSNEYSTVCFLINLSLFVNGATIYKNTTNINLIQKESMSYQCGEYKTISIDKIFLGQGLNGQLVNEKYIKLNQRFKVSEKIFEVSHSLFLFSSSFQMYIAVKDCSVYLLSFELNYISSLEFADGSNICKCFSQSIIVDSDFIGFVLGCNIFSPILKGYSYIDDYKDILLFGAASSTDIYFVNITYINYTPGKIKVFSKISGEFLLLTSENYEIDDINTFYSSHLTIFTGKISLDSYSIKEILCDYSSLFSLYNYYLSDYIIYYDPLFSNYFVYTLDIYFGLRIISISNDVCSKEFTLAMNETNIPYSLEICGQMMYVVNKDTYIYIYRMYNWTYPSYVDSMILISDIYETVQASLLCSSPIYPQYLLFQMKNATEIYLHVVDTQINAMANTVINYPITSFSENSFFLSYVVFLNSSGYLMIINSSYAQICIISPFVLVIDTNKDCNNYKNKFFINVTNTNSKKSYVEFTLTVKEYSQGSVNSTKIAIWELALFGISLFFLLVSIFICIKKIWAKVRTKKKVKVLFEYEENLVLSEERLAIDRINKSFD